ncbi:MAG: glycoside hydrolase family 25 protein, partial [Oscillospiraceae bacterium]|nr:glycoside hydrolase family 25 protein [Oscillospiraceae bacterium]
MKHVGKWISVILVLAAILVAVLCSLGGKWKDKVKNEMQELLERGRKNAYIAEEFYLDGQFLKYGDAECSVGIDVSTHQGEIDWDLVAESGVEFAILRAGYRGSTEGKLYEDSRFEENYRNAKEAGLMIGVYFFSQAVNESEAREEAQYLCELLDGRELDLPAFYDWEYLEGRVSRPRKGTLTKLVRAFCDEILREGYEPGVYFNRDYGDHYLKLNELEDCVLWLAEYATVPEASYHFDCVQYTDGG